MLRILILSSIFFTQFIYAQHPYYYTLNDEVGLPSNEVYCAIQDSNGFMWIGCEAGLFRYDGIQFTPYRNAKQNAKAISSLKFDYEGKLWCQNFAGQIFYVKNDSLVLFYDAKNKIIGHPSFDLDSEGNFYIGLANEIIKIDKHGKSARFNQQAIIARELRWIENGNYLFVYGQDSRLFLKVTEDKIDTLNFFNSTYKPDIVYVNKQNGSDGILFSKNLEGLFYFGHIDALIHQGAKLEIVPFGKTYCYAVHELDNSFWISTANGVLNYNQTKRLHLFAGEKISSMYKDREGNYWFTSLENGIHIIPSINSKLIDKYSSQISDQNISSIYLHNDSIMVIGTFSGQAFIFNTKNNALVKVYHQENKRYNTVSSIQNIGQDSLLVSRGVMTYLDKNFDLINEKTFDYLRDFVIINDTVFFTCSSGAGYFQKKELTSVDLYNSCYYTKVSSRNVEYDSLNKRLWFGLGNGLHYKAGNKLHVFIEDGDTLYPTDIKANDGIVWLGTINNGIIGVKNLAIEYRINQSNILKGNSVSSLFVNDEILVVATDVCINIIFKNNRSIEYLDITDGINATDINVIQADDSLLYLGSNKGLFIIPLNTIQPNTVKPYLAIVNFEVNGVARTFDDLIELNYKDELTVNFESVSLRARDKVKIQYRISHDDGRWIDLSNNSRSITISSLIPGENIIEIRAINEDGVMSVGNNVLIVYVNAPFWQKWWFYAIIVIVLMIVLILIYQSRIKSIRRKALMKEGLIKSQLKSIKAQMNPHFIFNSLNSIQDLILQQDVKNSYQYLNKFSSLMRKVLESSEEDEILLADEIQFLEIYLELEKLRFGSEFNYEIKLDQHVNPQRFHLPPMMVQPFVENAIKHGLLHKKGEKKVSIIFSSTQRGQLICQVIDNGIGRQKSAEIKERSSNVHSSFATGAIAQRLSLLNEKSGYKITFNIEDIYEHEKPAGTSVVIVINKS